MVLDVQRPRWHRLHARLRYLDPVQSPSLLDLPPIAADARLSYGDAPQQFGDLFLPKQSGRGALVMNVHGGYWKNKYDLTHASRFCRALADSGIAVWCIEYRRVGDPGGAWPGTFEDMLSAWKTLPRIAKQHSLNLARTAICGHSAGGQLALALASRHLEHPAKLAVSLAGVVDLQKAYDLHLSNDAVVKFMGGAPAQVPEHYAEADPMRVHIPVPQALFHGIPDDAVPVALSRDYAKTKTAQHEHVTYTESPTAGHFDWIDPRTPEFGQVRDALSKI